MMVSIRDTEEETLPINYYQQNFHQVAEFVYQTYRDLLDTSEQDWYENIRSCSSDAQRLYIRLLFRRRSVFRLRTLRYAEIQCIPKAHQELVTAGLIDPTPPKDLDALFRSLTKSEICRVLSLQRCSGKRKSELLVMLKQSDNVVQNSQIVLLQGIDQWLQPIGHQYWNVFRLCFFGNLYQDHSEFVTRDLGRVTYANYVIDSKSRPFSSREQVLAHLKYFECEALWEVCDIRSKNSLNNLYEHLPDAVDAEDLHLQRRLDRIRNKIARQFERLHEYDRSIELYRESIYPPARERLIRCYLKVNDINRARTLANTVLKEPFNEAELQVVKRISHRLLEKNTHRKRSKKVFKPTTTTLVLKQQKRRVELAALHYYASRVPAFYTENSLVCGVLGLFIWDIIFYPVKGAFFNPFQVAPADYHQQSFIQSRKSLIEDRFQELAEKTIFTNRVIEAFNNHHGIANPLMSWRRLSLEAITIALDRIPVTHWELMFTRLLSDLKDNTSGFPDLIVFDPKLRFGYEFIEVKGPGDSLQQNQIRWMSFFSQVDIPHRVVNVRWAVDTTRSFSSA